MSQENGLELGIFLRCVLHHPAEVPGEGGEGVEVGQLQQGLFGNGGEQIMEGIQVRAVPLREVHFPGNGLVKIPGAGDLGAVNGDRLHFSSP